MNTTAEFSLYPSSNTFRSPAFIELDCFINRSADTKAFATLFFFGGPRIRAAVPLYPYLNLSAAAEATGQPDVCWSALSRILYQVGSAYHKHE